MHYEINVALNGRHLFATHERSLTDGDKARKVLAILREKFPASEGYTIMCLQHKSSFVKVDL